MCCQVTFFILQGLLNILGAKFNTFFELFFSNHFSFFSDTNCDDNNIMIGNCSKTARKAILLN